MVDAITGVGTGVVAAYLSKDGLEKLLGPTAEYLGEGLRDLAKRRTENIGRILQNAYKKLGDKLDEPGTVSPRVLKTVINEGSYCEDKIAIEYFGGVLASSRTPLLRDDRGSRIAKIVDGLSTYQIRSHYLMYETIRRLFTGTGLAIDMIDVPKMRIMLPLSDFTQAMEFSEQEVRKRKQLLEHILFGLAAESLIDPSNWLFGPKAEMAKVYSDAGDSGIVFMPSPLGVEVFLWAFGEGNERVSYFLNPNFSPHLNEVANGVENAVRIKPNRNITSR